MKLKALLLSLLLPLCMATARAELAPLGDDELGAWTGQSGADIALLLQLNHTAWVDGSPANAPVRNSYCQTSFEFCRLAVQFNNRSVSGSDTLQYNNLGRKLWLVFKGVQGSINIPQLRLEGTDISYSNDAGNATLTQGAIQISFSETQPWQIRNFGFDSLSFEVDSTAGSNDGPLVKPSGTGVFNGKYTAAGFDLGRETGFLGLAVHGNLAVGGKMYMFSCSDRHMRC